MMVKKIKCFISGSYPGKSNSLFRSDYSFEWKHQLIDILATTFWNKKFIHNMYHNIRVFTMRKSLWLPKFSRTLWPLPKKPLRFFIPLWLRFLKRSVEPFTLFPFAWMKADGLLTSRKGHKKLLDEFEFSTSMKKSLYSVLFQNMKLFVIQKKKSKRCSTYRILRDLGNASDIKSLVIDIDLQIVFLNLLLHWNSIVRPCHDILAWITKLTRQLGLKFFVVNDDCSNNNAIIDCSLCCFLLGHRQKYLKELDFDENFE